jgi:hypothetical protein
MPLVQTVITTFIFFVVVISPHSSVAGSVENKGTCRFYGNTLEIAFVRDSDAMEGVLELRAAGEKLL